MVACGFYERGSTPPIFALAQTLDRCVDRPSDLPTSIESMRWCRATQSDSRHRTLVSTSHTISENHSASCTLLTKASHLWIRELFSKLLRFRYYIWLKNCSCNGQLCDHFKKINYNRILKLAKCNTVVICLHKYDRRYDRWRVTCNK